MYNLGIKLLPVFFLIQTVAVAFEDSEEAVDPQSLTKELCMKRRSDCCMDVVMGENPNLLKCMALHASNMPEDSEDNAANLRFASCLFECMYKKSKFIGKSDNLNMKMVHMQMEQNYPTQTDERAYNIKIYEHCRKITDREMGLAKSTPATSFLLKKLCRPYFTFLHMCYMKYHHENECPYYRWTASHMSESEAKDCKSARSKCYELFDLTPPKRLLE